MAVLSIIRPRSNRQAYRSVIERIDLDHNHPDGLIMHTAGEVDGAWQVVNVWDSEEYAERFEREVLLPAIREVAGDLERDVKTYELDHIVTP